MGYNLFKALRNNQRHFSTPKSNPFTFFLLPPIKWTRDFQVAFFSPPTLIRFAPKSAIHSKMSSSESMTKKETCKAGGREKVSLPFDTMVSPSKMHCEPKIFIIGRDNESKIRVCRCAHVRKHIWEKEWGPHKYDGLGYTQTRGNRKEKEKEIRGGRSGAKRLRNVRMLVEMR